MTPLVKKILLFSIYGVYLPHLSKIMCYSSINLTLGTQRFSIARVMVLSFSNYKLFVKGVGNTHFVTPTSTIFIVSWLHAYDPSPNILQNMADIMLYCSLSFNKSKIMTIHLIPYFASFE